MKIIIRVDASRWIGSGHVMRCLVLADSLKALGHQVIFVCRPQPSDLIDVISARGHNLLALPDLENVIIPKNSSDYAAWLQVSSNTDASQFLAVVKSADWVIVDHYGIGAEWENDIRLALKCKLLVIDDLVRIHFADVVLDQTFGRSITEYLDILSCDLNQPLVLAGSNYALLSSQFKHFRSQALNRKKPTNKVNILVTMGGVDEPNVTFSVLKTLIKKVEANFTVLLSQRAPHYNMVSSFCSEHKNVNHIDFTNDMATLMISHDVCVGAPGSTSWERACLGLPSILIPLAENQFDICNKLVIAGAAIKVDITEIETNLIKKYNKLINNWGKYYISSIKVCDGDGVQRVLSEILRLSK